MLTFLVIWNIIDLFLPTPTIASFWPLAPSWYLTHLYLLKFFFSQEYTTSFEYNWDAYKCILAFCKWKKELVTKISHEKSE